MRRMLLFLVYQEMKTWTSLGKSNRHVALASSLLRALVLIVTRFEKPASQREICGYKGEDGQQSLFGKNWVWLHHTNLKFSQVLGEKLTLQPVAFRGFDPPRAKIGNCAALNVKLCSPVRSTSGTKTFPPVQGSVL
jgi:hypothetical protein